MSANKTEGKFSKIFKILISIGLIAILFFSFYACERNAPEAEENIADTTEITEEGVLAPSQIDESMVGSFIKVRGKITSVLADPGGLAVWLSDNKGKVGIRIENTVWENMAKEEQLEYEKGKTITAEGMLVLTEGSELFIVLGVTPSYQEAGNGKFAEVEIVEGPINLSNNPEGFRDWPWPRIFIKNDKLMVIYWGKVNDRTAPWLIEYDGTSWSQPREIPIGSQFFTGNEVCFLQNWKYTRYEEKGNIGVAIAVTDNDYRLKDTIVVDSRPCINDIDHNTKPVGVLDSRDNIHIIWECDTEEGATDIYYASFDGKSLTDTVCLSNTPGLGSANPSIGISGDDIVYAFWSESDQGMSGDYDIYYSFLENGIWSVPENITGNKETRDIAAMPSYHYSASKEVHAFISSISGTEYAGSTHVVISKDKVTRKNINFSFCDIAYIAEGDAIHVVYGGWYPVSSEEPLTLKAEMLYNYFDGEEWYAGGGFKILSQNFYDNCEEHQLLLGTVGPLSQTKVELENGEIEVNREIHPFAVYKDGLIHVVFEYNQHGTYDAYYMAIKP